jgi:hypothetical protein
VCKKFLVVFIVVVFVGSAAASFHAPATASNYVPRKLGACLNATQHGSIPRQSVGYDQASGDTCVVLIDTCVCVSLFVS